MSVIDNARFGCDLYEGKDRFLLHDGRKCRQPFPPLFWLAAPGGLFMGFIFVSVAASETASGNAPWFFAPLVAFGILVGCAALSPFFFWRFYGRQTLQIDARRIRYDWWYFFLHGTVIFERDRDITVETAACEPQFGDKKLCLTFCKKQKLELYLATTAETDWVRQKLQAFLERVPPEVLSQDATKPARTVKGNFFDRDSGPAVLRTLDQNAEAYDGTLTRVVPGIERQSNSVFGPPEAMRVHCGHCQAYVPPERVWPDRAAAQCAECGAVFIIPELDRTTPPKQRRVKVERDDDSLVIRQGGNYGAIPMATFLSGLVGLVAVACLVLYVYHLTPNATLAELFPATAQNGNGPSDSSRMAANGMIIGLVFVLMLMPFWAFFERRTICIDRRECRMMIRWLFCRWERVISRHDVLFAEFRPWGLGQCYYLNYRGANGKRRSFLIGSDTDTSVRAAPVVGWLIGVTNHYLMTIKPETDEHTLQPYPFGGVYLGDEEPYLICPCCGNDIEPPTVNFASARTVCRHCNENFATQSLVFTGGKELEMSAIEGLECCETSETFDLRYKPVVPKAHKWGYLAMIIIGNNFFFGLFIALAVALVSESRQGESIVGALIFSLVFSVPFLTFFVLASCAEFRMFGDWEWRLRINSGNLKLWFRYKNKEREIEIPLDDVVVLDVGRNPNISIWLYAKSLKSGQLQIPLIGGNVLRFRDGSTIHLPGVVTPGNSAGQSHEFDIWLAARIKFYMAKCCRP